MSHALTIPIQPESRPIVLRRMLLDDVRSVVQVHCESFPGFFLSALGPGFLRLFYQAVLNADDGIAIVAAREDAIVGFACGSSAPHGFYRRLFKRQCWRFGWAAMRALVRRPSMVRRFIAAVGKRLAPTGSGAVAELMSLATLPHVQGQGIGRDLVTRFLSDARRAGATHVTLTTDSLGNERVNSFYRRLGFTLVDSFETNTGRKMNLYEINTVTIRPIG
jgi:ribosomal protein S18 acetylase RimI-like enzyme